MNSKERKEYDREYYLKNRAKKLRQSKENREKNPERRRQYGKQEKYKEYAKEYYKEHREERIMKMREHRKKRRLEYIKYLGGKCAKCGITERLEFDHINQESKKFNIGSRVAMKTDKLKEELHKCQLLCYDCHLEKTKQTYLK